MTEQSYLNPQYIKSQCDGAIKALNEDLKALEVTKTAITNFMNTSELKSDTFNSLKDSMNQYLFLIQELIAANHADLADFHTLSGSVGDEVLDGKIIKSNQQRAWNAKCSNETSASDYRCKAGSTDDMVHAAYYSGMAWYYDRLANNDYQTYCYWLGKEQNYDDIETSTKYLFENSYNHRAACMTDLNNPAAKGLSFNIGNSSISDSLKKVMSDAYAKPSEPTEDTEVDSSENS